jgi:uncharacterized membrane protein YeiH
MSLAIPLLVAAVSHPATASAAASVTSGASVLASAAAEATGSVASFISTTVPSIVASILPSGVTTTARDAFGVGIAVTVPPVWELLAVFAGALSGGLTAVRHRFDLVGIITLAIVTGLGGGIIRDLLLQRFGIAAFQDNRYLFTALVAATLVFFFSGAVRRLSRPMAWVDAVSLGMFVVVGADKALRADLNILPAIMLGVITATGGSVLRDLLSDEVPAILRPGALYSLAAMAGSTVFVLAAVWLGVVKEFAALFAIALAVALRFLALWRGWQSPVARDYSEHLTGLPRRLLSFLPFYQPPSEFDGRGEGGAGEDGPPSSNR